MNEPYSVGPTRRPKKRGAFPWLLFGCLGGVAALIFLVVAGILMIRMVYTSVVDNFTDTAPIALPESQMSADDYAKLKERVDAFYAAVEAGTATEPLELTADDINALIQNDPRWKDLRGHIHVTIDDGRITGQVSIPLDKLGLPGLSGRYANGSSTFSVSLQDGQLYVYLDSLTVKGKAVPDEIMADLRSENLASDYTRDPKVRESLSHYKSISVEDDTIRITPKAN